MKKMRLAAAATLLAFLALVAPHTPAIADGAASTRNIILGGAAVAGALILINHNRIVHERYAEDAAKQAALAQQRDNAWAAYDSEKQAYEHESTVAAELKKEVAYQHQIIEQQRHQLSMVQGGSSNFVNQRVAVVKTANGSPRQVAIVSYGWGSL